MLEKEDFRITLYKACSEGGGATISANEDGTRCAVAGRECQSLLKPVVFDLY